MILLLLLLPPLLPLLLLLLLAVFFVLANREMQKCYRRLKSLQECADSKGSLVVLGVSWRRRRRRRMKV